MQSSSRQLDILSKQLGLEVGMRRLVSQYLCLRNCVGIIYDHCQRVCDSAPIVVPHVREVPMRDLFSSQCVRIRERHLFRADSNRRATGVLLSSCLANVGPHTMTPTTRAAGSRSEAGESGEGNREQGCAEGQKLHLGHKYAPPPPAP